MRISLGNSIVNGINKSKKEGKDQESIQSSTTPLQTIKSLDNLIFNV